MYLHTFHLRLAVFSYFTISSMGVHKVAIIGSGPAGYTAAIYAARAGLNPVLFKGRQPGGQLSITSDVENYPGFPTGILGPEMMISFEKQALRFGTEIHEAEVTALRFGDQQHSLEIDNSTQIESQTLIMATGASAKWLGIDGEERLGGKGVSACAVCDGFFFKGLEVAVVGGGDSACEEAHYLSKLCKKVYLLVRREEMRASTIMQQRIQQTKNIEILFQHIPLKVLGNESVSGVLLEKKSENKTFELSVSAFFVAIGHQPNTAIVKGKLAMDKNGYIQTQADSSLTDVRGVFAAGDVQDSTYRQAVTAAGSGCMAALDAERYLASL